MNDSARAIAHQPVLLHETIDLLGVRPGGIYIDATVGDGGHAAAILERSAPGGRLLALDADPNAVAIARQRLSPYRERVVVVQSNYAHLADVARAHGFVQCDGILFDLGLSSRQLLAEGRGFSFQDESPLDMRLDETVGKTAADLVNSLTEEELADLLFQLGDEQASRRIARAIVEARPIITSAQLARIIEEVIGRRGRIHPATKTFLALRRAVNRDIETLESALPQAVALLTVGGRLAVIAFHSGEDRIVKNFMRRESQDCICPRNVPICVCGHRATLKIITRHAVMAGEDERRRNPRSRSARLRVAERINPG